MSPATRVRVLFRPPGEVAHYFVEESLSIARRMLGDLAGRSDVIVVYAPRYPSQIAYLDSLRVGERARCAS